MQTGTIFEKQKSDLLLQKHTTRNMWDKYIYSVLFL